MALFERALPDPAAATAALERELAHGGAFVPTPTPPPALSRVEVRVVLPDGAAHTAAGMAVNVVPGGFFVHFDRGPAVDALIAAARASVAPPVVPAVVPSGAAAVEAPPPGAPVDPSSEAPALEIDEAEPAEERQRLKSAWDLIDTSSTVPIHRQIAALTVPDRMRIARFANRPVRKVLIRDAEKRIHLIVMTNPRTSDSELEEWSAMPGLSTESLRWISTQHRLVARLSVQLNLVQNPSTPQEIALRLLAGLPIAEVHRVMKSTKVREVLRRAAKKRLVDTGNL